MRVVVVQRLAVRRLVDLVDLVVVLLLAVVLHLDRRGVVRRVCLRLRSIRRWNKELRFCYLPGAAEADVAKVVG